MTGPLESPPVLLLTFNRPGLARRALARIREAQPKQLFIAADGPRDGHPDDVALCAEGRRLVEEVDWHCAVQTLFRDRNLGCKRAVSGAITWFFDHVEEGIVLEDDCVADPSFFPFCAELLERHREDDRIAIISGDNFQRECQSSRNSYYFSIYPHIWGWATWRRAWSHFDGDLSLWPELRDTRWLEHLLGDKLVADYWRGIFDQGHAGQIDSWAYPWTFSCWSQHQLSILPRVNLVSNVGFDERGTHTRNTVSANAARGTREVAFPLRHPRAVVRDYDADAYTAESHFGIRPPEAGWRRAVRRVRRGLGRRLPMGGR